MNISRVVFFNISGLLIKLANYHIKHRIDHMIKYPIWDLFATFFFFFDQDRKASTSSSTGMRASSIIENSYYVFENV